MAEQDCANTGQDYRSTVEPDKTSLKRPCGSPTLCTPHRAERRVPLRELGANEVCNEVPRVTLFNPPSMNAASEGGSSNPTNAQMIKIKVVC